MYRDKKISPATKMIILFMYTFIIFALSITIITVANLDETQGYGSLTRDENIQVVAKLVESRTAGDLSDNTKKEKSKWTLTFQVTKRNPEKKVEDIIIYAKGKTEEGKHVYFESTKKSPSKDGTAFLTFPKSSYSGTQIQKTNEYKISTESYTKTNSFLSMVYVNVLYKVDGEDKELKFYFVPSKAEQFNFSNISEVVDLTENKEKRIIFNKNNYTTISVTPTLENSLSTTEKVTNDQLLFELKANEQLLREEGLSVVDANVTMFAKVKNDKTDTEQYFSDYVLVADLHGTFVDDSNSKSWSDRERLNLATFYSSNCSINTTYDVSELFLIVNYTTSDGKTHSHQLKINLKIK